MIFQQITNEDFLPFGYSLQTKGSKNTHKSINNSTSNGTLSSSGMSRLAKLSLVGFGANAAIRTGIRPGSLFGLRGRGFREADSSQALNYVELQVPMIQKQKHPEALPSTDLMKSILDPIPHRTVAEGFIVQLKPDSNIDQAVEQFEKTTHLKLNPIKEMAPGQHLVSLNDHSILEYREASAVLNQLILSHIFDSVVINDAVLNAGERALSQPHHGDRQLSMDSLNSILNLLNNRGFDPSADSTIKARFADDLKGLNYASKSYFPEQWYLYAKDVGINITSAWDYNARGQGINVGVIDTGQFYHNQMVGKNWPGVDTIDGWNALDGDGKDHDASESPCIFGLPYGYGHGSAIAAIIAAPEGDTGVMGIAPNATIVHARVVACWPMKSDVIDAINWLAGEKVEGLQDNENPVDVINMSLGIFGFSCPKDLQDAIDNAVSKGISVVAASGTFYPISETVVPAICNGVIAAGATTMDGNRVPLTGFGRNVILSAPGEKLLTAFPKNSNPDSFDN